MIRTPFIIIMIFGVFLLSCCINHPAPCPGSLSIQTHVLRAQARTDPNIFTRLEQFKAADSALNTRHLYPSTLFHKAWMRQTWSALSLACLTPLHTTHTPPHITAYGRFPSGICSLTQWTVPPGFQGTGGEVARAPARSDHRVARQVPQGSRS